MPRKQKSTKTRKPLTISIHGEGVDIDAKISNMTELGAVSASLAERLAGSLRTPPFVEAPPPQQHDFDLIQRLIKHADPKVLQAMIDLAKDALERRAAS